jgi:hypothetical protein
MKCPDANNDSQKSRRIFVEDVASILGVPLGMAQLMASRGELPSAVKAVVVQRTGYQRLAQAAGNRM